MCFGRQTLKALFLACSLSSPYQVHDFPESHQQHAVCRGVALNGYRNTSHYSPPINFQCQKQCLFLKTQLYLMLLLKSNFKDNSFKIPNNAPSSRHFFHLHPMLRSFNNNQRVHAAGRENLIERHAYSFDLSYYYLLKSIAIQA